MMKNNFKKIDLANNLSRKKGFSVLFSKKIIDDLIETLIFGIKNKNMSLKNIGSFNKIYKSERMGRNPKTKENFIIKSRITISFIPSKKLIKYIN